ncbi:MAG: YdcF family protein [Betaproteobacteria bacterium]|nr:MAG: YdcF family protein [Betaproteobacteria bacterium]
MDTLFFWLSKLIWLIISPDSLLLILLLLSFALLLLGKDRAGTKLLGFVCAVLLIVALLPLHNLLLYPLETRFKTNPEMPDSLVGIIVLGGAEGPYLSALWNQVEVGPAAERFLAFLALAKQYPEAKLVFAGGTGSLIRQEFKGADVAETLFQQQGLDVTRVVFERESRNTYENALFTRELIQPGEGESWLLITTAWHMPRSVGVFCKQQWPVIPYPVDHTTEPDHLISINFALASHLRDLGIGAKEWIALLVYYITGKTTALLPSQCDWTDVPTAAIPTT